MPSHNQLSPPSFFSDLEGPAYSFPILVDGALQTESVVVSIGLAINISRRIRPWWQSASGLVRFVGVERFPNVNSASAGLCR